MDTDLILEFQDLKSAETCLSVINNIAAAYWVSQGYKVIDTPTGKALVSKNAATGKDMTDGVLTTTWDLVQESPEKTFYFSDPAQREQFSKWQDRANELGYVFNGTKKAFPKEWIPQERK